MKTIHDFFAFPMVKGTILGGVVTAAATPGINLVASYTIGTPMPWSKPFTGARSLATAGSVACGTGFIIRHLLGGNTHDASEWTRLWTASVGGMVSGLTTCPFESIAQTQLTTKTSLSHTAHTIYQHHGLPGFFRGAASMAVREGAWFPMYMGSMPILSQRLQDAGYEKSTAHAIAIASSAGLFGVISAPVNRLRIMKQDKLVEPNTPATSYPNLLRAMVQECPDLKPIERTARFFKGAAARSVTSAVAGGLFFYGNEMYGEAINRSKHV